jgi:GntR family transcriptional regulator
MSRTTPLLIATSAADPRPLIRQIADAIRLQVASGELPVGAQLPSVRGLAQQLCINHNTVAKAYGDLVAEGWLVARQGLGLFVAERRQRMSEEEREHRLQRAVDALTADVVGLGFSADHVVKAVRDSLSACLTNVPKRSGARR